MFNVYLDAPNLGEDEKKYLLRAISEGYVSTKGPFVQEFEEKFARYLGVKKAIAVQSGTAALHIALYQLGIGRDDEVIIPSLTFVATVNSVLYVGAKPVIVDVDSETWNIDPEKIEKAITRKTKAIIPVHLYGNPCDMDSIMKIAKKYNLYVVEDATESFGATYKGKQTGTFGDFGCFSFNGNKLITTGGGGMVVTDDKEEAEHIRFLVHQAKDEKRGYYHPEMGFNYRMTNLEASLGLAQLKKASFFLEKKKKFRKIYQQILGKIPYVKFQKEYEGAKSSWWFTCIRVEKKKVDINVLMQRLKEKGVHTRRLFYPLHKMPYLKVYPNFCPTACRIFERGVCLPSSTLNTFHQIRKGALILREILDE